MIKNDLVFLYHKLNKKYVKYFLRLQRHLRKGSYKTLTVKRRKNLIDKVEKLYQRLSLIKAELSRTTLSLAVLSLLGFQELTAQPFVRNDAKNPFNYSKVIQNFNHHSSPAVADLDHDGDCDILISAFDSLQYFKNTGTASAPLFELQLGTDNPFDQLSLPYTYATLSLSDMDGDGDFDLLAGGYFNGSGKQIAFFQNTGTASNPFFLEKSGTDNIFPSTSAYVKLGSVAPVDIDADGDVDVFLMDNKYGSVSFFENTGSSTDPVFIENTSFHPFPYADIRFHSDFKYVLATFVDIDGDGDQDAAIGEDAGILYYKNTGTATAASFAVQTISNNPFLVNMDRWQSPALADLNDDGTLDLIDCSFNSTSIYFNLGTTTAPLFKNANFDFGTYINIRCEDIDGDHDKDVMFSGYPPDFLYARNEGPVSHPVFEKIVGAENPFQNIPSRICNAFADLDADHDLDLVVEDINLRILYYENQGTANAPSYVLKSNTENPFYGLTSNVVRFTLADLDNDGDIDMIVAPTNAYGFDNSIYYYKNTGSATLPIFTAQSGTNNPFTNLRSQYSYLTFVDFDTDGDLDLVNGTGSHGIFYFQNSGTATSPSYAELTGLDNPFNSIGEEFYTLYMQSFSTAFIDIENDGDLDFFLSNRSGYTYLYENQNVNVITDIQENQKTALQENILVFPNPAMNVLGVSYTDEGGGAVNVTIYDAQGQEVLNYKVTQGNGLFNIDISSLRMGVHILRLTSNEKVSVTQFIKE